MFASKALLLVLVSGCGPSGPPDTAEADLEAAELPDDDEPIEPEEPRPRGDIQGFVLTSDGTPATNVRLTLCHFACRFADPDPATGAFLYDDVVVDRYALHVEELGDEQGLVPVLTMVDVLEDQVLELDRPFTIEAGPTGLLATGVSELQIGQGFFVTVDADALELPFGTEQPLVGGIRATEMPPQLPVDEALAAWLLEPFDATSSVPMSVRIANEWELAPGTTLRMHAASYADYDWISAGEVTVSEDGTELVGGALTVLSTLVLEGPS